MDKEKKEERKKNGTKEEYALKYVQKKKNGYRNEAKCHSHHFY